MRRLLFDKPGRFFRGNIHTHSTRSDGRRPPAQVVAAYRDHGYDFLAITDHFRERYGFPITDTSEFRSDSFTTIFGAELHAPCLQNGEDWHILAAGLPLDFAPTTPDETGPELAARAASAGAFVGIAHPAWYSLTVDDALSVEAAHSVEVYNKTIALENDRGEAWYMSDLLSLHGRRLTAYVADDAHFNPGRPQDHRAAWVHVRAESLDPDAIVTALKAGDFYSSQGPEIHDIAIEHGRVAISCSPAASVFVTGRAQLSQPVYGAGITNCKLPLSKFAGSYFRVTIIDHAGKRAWSNPIWLD